MEYARTVTAGVRNSLPSLGAALPWRPERRRGSNPHALEAIIPAGAGCAEAIRLGSLLPYANDRQSHSAGPNRPTPPAVSTPRT